jgi:hypothetical protein
VSIGHGVGRQVRLLTRVRVCSLTSAKTRNAEAIADVILNIELLFWGSFSVKILQHEDPAHKNRMLPGIAIEGMLYLGAARLQQCWHTIDLSRSLRISGLGMESHSTRSDSESADL